MTTNIERASIVARHVQLESVTLASAELSTKLDPLDIPNELEVSMEYRGNYRPMEQHPNHLYVLVEMKFMIFQGEESNSLLKLQVAYNLVYKLEGAATFPSDALTYFADLNGTYNAWPYLRELVQTVAGRVGFGGVMLPVFRPSIQQIEETASQPATVNS